MSTELSPGHGDGDAPLASHSMSPDSPVPDASAQDGSQSAPDAVASPEVSPDSLKILASALSAAEALLQGVHGLGASQAPTAVHRIDAVSSTDKFEIGGGLVYEYPTFVLAKGPGKMGPAIVLIATSVPDLAKELGSRYSLTKLSPSDLAIALPSEPPVSGRLRAPLADLLKAQDDGSPISALMESLQTADEQGSAPLSLEERLASFLFRQ